MKRDLQPFPPSVMTANPRLIVCERMGTWAARMRPHVPSDMQLRQTRSLDECTGELRQAPGSLMVVEVTSVNLEEVLDMSSDLGRWFPHARLVAVSSRGNEAYETLLREAGAVHFATSPRTAKVLARMAVRHAARVPRPRTTLSSQIWESLPWHEAATR